MADQERPTWDDIIKERGLSPEDIFALAAESIPGYLDSEGRPTQEALDALARRIKEADES